MEISDVRVKLIQDAGDRLKAVCSITLDDEFVVRDLKVVEGTNGLFVAMPSRKLSVHCPQCRSKNHLRARFCNECGTKLPPARPVGDAAGRVRMHRDIAHPINPSFREIVQSTVIEKYKAEAELAKSPDYQPADIDAEFEESTEESSSTYAPSEYDQLIAGLNKGNQQPVIEEQPRQPQRPSRQPDRRRGERPERSGGPSRGQGVRKPVQARGDARRSESPRTPRANEGFRPRVQPARSEGGFNEVNGNVALPGEPPMPYPRRTGSPGIRRTEEPRYMAEPQLDQFDEPTPRPSTPPRRTEEAPQTEESRERPESTRGAVEDTPSVETRESQRIAQTAPRPQTPVKPPASAGGDDLPFGAGL